MDKIYEVAPEGMENWIKKRKPEFKKKYGDKWKEVLYATAWKMKDKMKKEDYLIDVVSDLLSIDTDNMFRENIVVKDEFVYESSENKIRTSMKKGMNVKFYGKRGDIHRGIVQAQNKNDSWKIKDESGKVWEVWTSDILVVKELGIKESLEEGRKDYEVYHKTYTSALQEVEKFLEKNRFFFDGESFAQSFGFNVSKPSEGKTVVGYILLYKDSGLEKEANKVLQLQIYGMSNSFELNMYFGSAKAKDYTVTLTHAYTK